LVAKLTPSWQLGYFASVRFVIFVVILQLGFFVTKQLLDPLTLGRIGGNFEQFRIVLNVLPYDKAFQRASSRSAVSQRLELDRSVPATLPTRGLFADSVRIFALNEPTRSSLIILQLK
jgi:hypothetical protein